ncbi:hypothetical protein EVB99_005 [Rhizobium phage RHph_N3_19]|nr:hypothetical protein EVB99_005 [Rhizobium phage RHph_N3_19]
MPDLMLIMVVLIVIVAANVLAYCQQVESDEEHTPLDLGRDD